MNSSLNVACARIRATRLLALVAILAMPVVGLSTGFAQSGSPEERAISVFSTSAWRIESISLDGVAVPLSDSVETNLILVSAMPALSGTVGCNRTTASFTLGEAAGEISFAPIISTMMACPEPAMTQERAAFDALEATTGYRHEAGRLVLSGPSSELVLVASTAANNSTDTSMGNEFMAFNAAVANAAAAGARWPTEALRVAFAYVDLLGGSDTAVTLAAADGSQLAGEEPDNVVVTISERGLLDDSLSGAVQRVNLARSGTFWVVVGHETVWLCRRGPDSQLVEPERCP